MVSVASNVSAASSLGVHAAYVLYVQLVLVKSGAAGMMVLGTAQWMIQWLLKRLWCAQ